MSNYKGEMTMWMLPDFRTIQEMLKNYRDNLVAPLPSLSVFLAGLTGFIIFLFAFDLPFYLLQYGRLGHVNQPGLITALVCGPLMFLGSYWMYDKYKWTRLLPVALVVALGVAVVLR